MHLPPDAHVWDPEVYVAHIDGEGMEDPKIPRPFPNNLVNFNEGPTIYNLRTKCARIAAAQPPANTSHRLALLGRRHMGRFVLCDSPDWTPPLPINSSSGPSRVASTPPGGT